MLALLCSENLCGINRSLKSSKENAIKYADSKNNVSLQIRLNAEKNYDLSNEQLVIVPDELDKFKVDDEFH